MEQKPRAPHVHDSHVLQVAAECLLVNEVYGVRPAYEVLVLASGRLHRVPFTCELEERLHRTFNEMHCLLETSDEPGQRWMGGRCRACGYFETCWE